ncbi:MAG: carboxypeptidase regulatory-like domain-containing protein [Gemmatimonadaceae bacterium]
MTSSTLFHEGRRWATAAALVVTAGQAASAQVSRPTAMRDTVAAYAGSWREELPTMLAHVGSVLDSGFAASERDLVLRQMRAIQPQAGAGINERYPGKDHQFLVRFRGGQSAFSMYAYWPDTGHVAFRVRSPDTLLIAAIDSSFRAARAPLLSPPSRVRVTVRNMYEHGQLNLGLTTDEAKHCPRFGLETHGEARGDTLAIHVDGAAPRNSCPRHGEWPPRMSYWLPVTPGVYHLEIDYGADTNLFSMRVTDTSVALSTIRSSFATADERPRVNVPKGSFALKCLRDVPTRGAGCDELQSWAARRPGLRRIAVDTDAGGPWPDSEFAYRYADERVLAGTLSCIQAAKWAFKRDARVELWIRSPWGPFLSRGAIMTAENEVRSDSACALPASIVGPQRPASPDCPVPAMGTRNLVVELFLRQQGTQQWLREHGVPMPTAENLEPLSGPGDAARCRHIDSTSSRHPVPVFRAGHYFVATNIGTRPVGSLDELRLYLVWVLDSANNVVHVPTYSTGGDMPRDLRVTSTRDGVVILQWTRPMSWPSRYELQRATETGEFVSIGAPIAPTAVAAGDRTADRGTAYRYRLRAPLVLDQFEYSNEVRVTIPTWPPEPYVRPALHGRVLDSLTGKPVPGLLVGIRGARETRTDSLGRYLLAGLPPGTHDLSFQCPSTRVWWGRRSVRTRRIEAGAATDSVADFLVRFRTCDEPPLRSWTGEFRGHYSGGFETSSFTPCKPFQSFAGTAYEELGGGSAWVTFSKAANRQVESKWPASDAPDQESSSIYVRWRGTVTGPGGYGHMSVAMYDLRVTEVVEMRRSFPSDCRP